jgi:post-segregation antitoxin (ccd killing protein)
MNIEGLNHFNITAPRELLERVRDFYVNVLWRGSLSQGLAALSSPSLR